MNNKLFHIQWHITERCNLKCTHCYREPYRKELGFDELISLANKIIKFANNSGRSLIITLTGGEPFLKPEVYDLALYLDNIDAVKTINFITNGTIIPDSILQTISKLNMLYVSLESHQREINDLIRGNSVFKKVTKNLEQLVYNYKIGLMTTLLNSNIHSLIDQFEEFINFFFSKGIYEIVFERFIPVGEAKKLKHELLPNEKILMFYKKLAEVLDVDYDILKYYPAVKLRNNYKDDFKLESIEVLVAECIFGRDGFAILCDGTIYPCRRFDTPIANVLDDEKFEIELIKGITDKIKEQIKIAQQDCFVCYATIKI
ncbi:MAG: radical SAM protein [Endomicrobia bacterium]|nr:radical SAM protein [Endomicrobiia bacterium]